MFSIGCAALLLFAVFSPQLVVECGSGDDSTVRTVEVDGKSFQMTRKGTRKLMHKLAKAVTATAEKPDVKRMLDGLKATVGLPGEAAKEIQEKRMRILMPIWGKTLTKLCVKFGFKDFMEALRACMQFVHQWTDREIFEGVQQILAVMEGKEEPESTSAEAGTHLKKIKDLAMRFIKEGKSIEDKEEDLGNAREYRRLLTFGGTTTNAVADVIVETMERTLRIGDRYVEDEMVELYPNVTRAVKGSEEHAEIMNRVQTLALFVTPGAQRRISKRMQIQVKKYGGEAEVSETREATDEEKARMLNVANMPPVDLAEVEKEKAQKAKKAKKVKKAKKQKEQSAEL